MFSELMLALWFLMSLLGKSNTTSKSHVVNDAKFEAFCGISFFCKNRPPPLGKCL